MEDLISIIIPVYNVEKYLCDCLDSVVNQTYKNIEIVLVDDGSTDNSGTICDEYAKKDKRVKVFHIENKGVSDARNFGVIKSLGKYITFIDSDDIVSKRYTELLYSILKSNNADISQCLFKRFSHTKNIVENIKCSHVEVYNSLYALQNLYNKKNRYFNSTYVCGKLIKRKLVEDFKFPTGKMFEDSFVVYKYFFNSHFIACINQELYYYRISENSRTEKEYTLRFLDGIEVLEEIMLFFKKQQIVNRYLILNYLSQIRSNYFYILENNIDYNLTILHIKYDEYKNSDSLKNRLAFLCIKCKRLYKFLRFVEKIKNRILKTTK